MGCTILYIRIAMRTAQVEKMRKCTIGIRKMKGPFGTTLQDLKGTEYLDGNTLRKFYNNVKSVPL